MCPHTHTHTHRHTHTHIQTDTTKQTLSLSATQTITCKHMHIHHVHWKSLTVFLYIWKWKILIRTYEGPIIIPYKKGCEPINFSYCSLPPVSLPKKSFSPTEWSSRDYLPKRKRGTGSVHGYISKFRSVLRQYLTYIIYGSSKCGLECVQPGPYALSSMIKEWFHGNRLKNMSDIGEFVKYFVENRLTSYNHMMHAKIE